MANSDLSGAWGTVPLNQLDSRDVEFKDTDKHDASGEWRLYFFRMPTGEIGYRSIGDLEVGEPGKSCWFDTPF